jgi:hypothetical protein
MFAAGVATFGSLYCVQPLLPEFSRCYRRPLNREQLGGSPRRHGEREWPGTLIPSV